MSKVYSRDEPEGDYNIMYTNYYIDVTDEVKGVFGNIVTKAERQVYSIAADRDKIGVQAHITHAVKHRPLITATRIDLDARDYNIIVYFVNGKVVRFSVSEWGSITSEASS